MASKHQAQIPRNKLSSQAKNAEIFSNLHSSLIYIGQLCDNEWIVNFDKHKVIVSKNKDIIIEGHWDPTNGLWWFPIQATVVIDPTTFKKYSAIGGSVDVKNVITN